jgi:HEAT repeat protein
VRLGPIAVDPLIAALNSQDDDVRRKAAEALGYIKDKRAIDALTHLLKDPKSEVRSQADWALARINGSPEGAPASADVKEQDKLLCRLGAGVLDIKDLRENKQFSDESLFQSDPVLKQRLTEWERSAPRSVASQIKILRDGDNGSKANAAIQLRSSGALAQGAILALVETIYDPRVDKKVYLHQCLPIAMTTVSSAVEAAQTLVGIGEPAIDSIIAVIKNGDSNIRQLVVQELGTISDLRLVESLITLLEDDNSQTRETVIRALETVKDPLAVDLLLATLKDGGVRKQSGVAQILGQIGVSRAVEPLIAYLKSEQPLMRQSAIQALGQIKNSRAIEPLIAVLKDDKADIRLAVIQALEQINDPRTVKSLISSLDDEDIRIRDCAARALKNFSDQPSLDLLAAALKSPSFRTRNAVIRVLAQIGDPKSVGSLIAASRDKDIIIRQSAIEALGQIEDPSAMAAINDALQDADQDVRIAAIRAVGKMSNLSQLEHLISGGQARSCSY